MRTVAGLTDCREPSAAPADGFRPPASCLAGAFWGQGSIPPDWIRGMRGRDIVGWRQGTLTGDTGTPDQQRPNLPAFEIS
jgi:hypothetical protein